MSKILQSVALLLVLSGCGNPESKVEAPPVPAPMPAPTPDTVAPAPSPAPEAPLPSAEALPIPEDFEAEAETTITKDSYKKELAALDKEIQADEKADMATKSTPKAEAKPK